MAEGGQQNNNSTIAIVIVTVLVLTFIVFIVGLSISGGGNDGPNPSGKQTSEAINPFDPKTKELLDTFQVLSRPQDVLAHPEKLDALKGVLQALVQGIEAKDPAYATIPDGDKVLTIAKRMQEEIRTIQTNAVSNKAAAKAALTALQADAKAINDILPTNTIATVPPKDGFALPIQLKDIKGSFNKKPHGSLHHTALLGIKWGCNLYGTRTCMQGDAADVDAPAGKPVYAPFSAKVVATGTARKGTSGAGYKIVLISNDPKHTYDAAMLHLNPDGLPAVGSTVQVGQQIGTVYHLMCNQGTTPCPHLHFELWVDGKVISSDGARGGSIGEKVWNNQKKALGF